MFHWGWQRHNCNSRVPRCQSMSRRQAMVGCRASGGNTVPVQNQDGPKPLRNWNSFWPLIELHYVISLYYIRPLCVSVCLTLFQLHIKKAICSKKASQHTMCSHLIHKFPLPSIQTRHCPPSHQFSSLISSLTETKVALQSFILQQSKFHRKCMEFRNPTFSSHIK